MIDPNTVFTVALSRAQINELLVACGVINPTPPLREAQAVLRRAVRPAHATNDSTPERKHA